MSCQNKSWRTMALLQLELGTMLVPPLSVTTVKKLPWM